MNNIEVDVVTFQDFLAEDTKTLLDTSNDLNNGDKTADAVKEPAESKIDKDGICTDDRQGKANKEQGDKEADKLTEDKEDEVGTDKSGLDKSDEDDEGEDE